MCEYLFKIVSIKDNSTNLSEIVAMDAVRFFFAVLILNKNNQLFIYLLERIGTKLKTLVQNTRISYIVTKMNRMYVLII